MAGFANGLCAYDFIAQYEEPCSVLEGGNCDIDVNECVSSPCKNSAQCSDSTSDGSVPPNSYRCTCVEDFATFKFVCSD